MIELTFRLVTVGQPIADFPSLTGALASKERWAKRGFPSLLLVLP